MLGKKADFRLIPTTDDHAEHFCCHLAHGANFQYTFTGSIPMRPIDMVEHWKKERAAGSVLWSIVDDSYCTSQPLMESGFYGTVGLHSHRDIYRSWEFRIFISSPGCLGRGIGTEAATLAVDWAFKRLNAHRVWLGVNSENAGAVKCYEKVGFKREGVLREDIFCMGRYMDVIRMAVLENEWTSPTSVEVASAPSATKS